MDLVAPHPIFNLYNAEWPVFTSFRTLPPAKVVAHGEFGAGEIANSMLSQGCIVTGATVRNSVLSPNVRIEPGAVVEAPSSSTTSMLAPAAVVRKPSSTSTW